MKKILAAVCALAFSATILSGCSVHFKSKEPALSPEEEAAQNEIRQNDYRGSVIRTQALQQNVLTMMENMKQNNVTLRTDNPNSFWTQDGYQDFVVNFLNSDIIDDTQWFNEEEYDWEETLDVISTTEGNLTHQDGDKFVLNDNVTILRNEKDDYSMTAPGSIWYQGVDYGGALNYRILYDCDKDWAKAYAETNMNADVPSITAKLYEYARIDNNTFAIQTSKERLVVVLEDAVEDTDLKDRNIKEFYYSKLTTDGERTTFEPYMPRKTTMPDGTFDEEAEQKNYMMAAYPFINEKGDIYNLYGKSNSIFLTDDITTNLNGNWVFEDKSLQQAIVFKDGALVVVTYNKLSENYERFIYTLPDTPDAVVNELVGMVEIKDLVGTKKTMPAAVKPTDETAKDEASQLYGDIDETVDVDLSSATATTTAAADTPAPETSVSEEGAVTSAPAETVPADTSVSAEGEQPADTEATTEAPAETAAPEEEVSTVETSAP